MDTGLYVWDATNAFHERMECKFHCLQCAHLEKKGSFFLCDYKRSPRICGLRDVVVGCFFKL